jgi:hypothetical protein
MFFDVFARQHTRLGLLGHRHRIFEIEHQGIRAIRRRFRQHVRAIGGHD